MPNNCKWRRSAAAITLRETSGALTLKTVSGAVDAGGLNTPAVSLNTVSGDARLSFAAPFSGSVAGTTVSGDLTLALWDNSDTRLDMTTTSGHPGLRPAPRRPLRRRARCAFPARSATARAASSSSPCPGDLKIVAQGDEKKRPGRRELGGRALRDGGGEN